MDNKYQEIEELLNDVSGKRFDELSFDEMESISGAVKDVDGEAAGVIVTISVAACVSFITGVIGWTVGGKK